VTCYRYQAKPSLENNGMADRPIRLMTNQRNWGYAFQLPAVQVAGFFGETEIAITRPAQQLPMTKVG
jgi:hypothetical protein